MMTVDVDRTRAQQIGLTQKDVAQSLLVALSGSFQTTPSFYLDPKNGVTYNVAIQAPQYKVDSLAALQSLPITARRRQPGGQRHRRARRPAHRAGAGQPGLHHPRRRTGHREPLQRAAGHRHLRQRGWNRPGQRDRKMEKIIDTHRPSCRAARTSSCAARARP
jgi:hypothetical protein